MTQPSSILKLSRELKAISHRSPTIKLVPTLLLLKDTDSSKKKFKSSFKREMGMKQILTLSSSLLEPLKELDTGCKL
jgi:hypothetical protein